MPVLFFPILLVQEFYCYYFIIREPSSLFWNTCVVLQQSRLFLKQHSAVVLIQHQTNIVAAIFNYTSHISILVYLLITHNTHTYIPLYRTFHTQAHQYTAITSKKVIDRFLDCLNDYNCSWKNYNWHMGHCGINQGIHHWVATMFCRLNRSSSSTLTKADLGLFQSGYQICSIQTKYFHISLYYYLDQTALGAQHNSEFWSSWS